MNLVTYDDVQEVLTGHHDEDSAFVQDDYPYGRHRTQRRVWVETASKGSKKDQQRFMAQTLNPKTDRWNKAKASTYSDIIILYLDSNEHVKQACLSTWSSAEQIALFVETFGQYLTDHQRSNIRYLDAMRRVSSRIEWKIRDPKDDSPEQSHQEQANIINRMIVQELRKPSQQPVM